MDSKPLREAFADYITGVTVVTTIANGKNYGFTANSFTSISLDPPLLLVCISKHADLCSVFINNEYFAINILAQHQRSLSQQFSQSDVERFSNIDWSLGKYGCPVLGEVCSWFECRNKQIYEQGDHVILIGEILHYQRNGGYGLGYMHGVYFSPALENKAREILTDASQVVAGVIVEHKGQVLLQTSVDDYLNIPTVKITIDQGIPTVFSQFIHALSKQLNINIKVGFIYSVYEDKSQKQQYIVYHCRVIGEVKNMAYFHLLDKKTLSRIKDGAIFSMLERFNQELKQGNYGIYLGDNAKGQVKFLR